MAFYRNILVISSCALSTWVSAQSVVNGGFEALVGYPNTTGQWSLATGWLNTGSEQNDPDIYHMLGSGGGDLPETPVAIVTPYQGMAIAGLVICGNTASDGREYLTGTFSAPLESGMKYRMEFAMTNGELTPYSMAGFGVSGMGMHFSMGPLQQAGGQPIEAVPQFVLSPVFYNRNWENIAFTFTATAAWTHFTWGLFSSESNHQLTIEEGSNPTMAYCFVDDFSIEQVDTEIVSDVDADRGPEGKPHVSVVNLEKDPSWFVPNAFTPNGDGDNDIFTPILSNSTLKRFEIFNRWGQVLFSMKHPNEGWDGKNANGAVAEPGMYIWQLEVKNDDGSIVRESGALTLIR